MYTILGHRKVLRSWFGPSNLKLFAFQLRQKGTHNSRSGSQALSGLEKIMVNTYLGMYTYLSYLRLICRDNLDWLKSGYHAGIKQAQFKSGNHACIKQAQYIMQSACTFKLAGALILMLFEAFLANI